MDGTTTRNKLIACAGAQSSEHGAVFAELVITLPVFLAGVLTLMWMGVVFNARSSLTTAVGTSVRMASTRGDRRLVGADIIADVGDYQNNNAISPALQTLLSSPSELGTFQVFYSNLGTSPAGSVFSRELREMPAEYIYALIYAYDALRQNIGPTVRFPCNPENASGEGCVNCTFLNPDNMSPTDPYTGGAEPPRRSIGLRCSMQPSLFLATPLIRVLRMITGNGENPNIVISRSIFFHSPATE